MKRNTIMLADSDPEIIKSLGDALKGKGMDLLIAKDGPSALQIAVKSIPDIILMDIAIPLLNGVKIAQILKSNPNLRDIPIIFSCAGKINPDYVPYFQNTIITKPFNIDEVLNRVDADLLRVEKIKEVGREVKEVEGNLAQMPLVDILQIFSMNRKGGVIVVRKENKGKEAMIFMKRGQIVNASVDTVKGEKALYRLLMWESGKFEYVPSDFQPEIVIAKSTDSLLMEGMRQLDEWKKMAEDLPSMQSLLYLKVDRGKLSKGLRPLTQEVISLLEFYNKVEDIVNNSSYSDFEVMMTIHTLISKGILEVSKEARKDGSDAMPLLTSEEAFAIKENLKNPLKEGYEMDVVKIPIFARGLEDVKKIVNLFVKINGFKVNNEFFSAGQNDTALGNVGRFKASESITILFTVLPINDMYSPLWKSLMGNSIGFVVLRGGSDEDNGLARTIRNIEESGGRKAAIINLKEGLADVEAGEGRYQINMWEVDGKDSGNMLHDLLDSFLNLS